LIERLGKGDETAFRLIYDQHWNKVYTLALMYLKNVAAAQDVVQEVFEKLWIRRAEMSDTQQLGAYLYVMARNHVVSSLRRKALVYVEDVAKIGMHAAPSQAPDYASPDRILEVREVELAIRRAVDQLSPQQKKVFTLAREQDLPLQEVARLAGISYHTAREYMSSALKSIRAFLAEHLGELPVLIILFFL
jgi:RNA polymerase sigma-70 factor (family 1)